MKREKVFIRSVRINNPATKGAEGMKRELPDFGQDYCTIHAIFHGQGDGCPRCSRGVPAVSASMRPTVGRVASHPYVLGGVCGRDLDVLAQSLIDDAKQDKRENDLRYILETALLRLMVSR
jgi:hypothetical protein